MKLVNAAHDQFAVDVGIAYRGCHAPPVHLIKPTETQETQVGAPEEER